MCKEEAEGPPELKGEGAWQRMDRSWSRTNQNDVWGRLSTLVGKETQSEKRER